MRPAKREDQQSSLVSIHYSTDRTSQACDTHSPKMICVKLHLIGGEMVVKDIAPPSSRDSIAATNDAAYLGITRFMYRL